MSRNDAPAFSYPVKVGHVSANPIAVTLKADVRECASLATLWNVSSVSDFSAELQAARWKKDGVRVRGRVRTTIVQSSVVSLQPVETVIDEPVDAIFVPEGSRLARIDTSETMEMMLDPDGPDSPELFSGDTIDVGAVAAEYAALAIDPYPRLPGEVFSDHVESTDATDAKPSPFAALKDWKKD